MRATIGSLSKKIEHLYAENARLRAALEAAPSLSAYEPSTSAEDEYARWYNGPRAEALKEKP